MIAGMRARPALMSLALSLVACGPTSTNHGDVDGRAVDMPKGSSGGCWPGNGWVSEQVTQSSSTGTYDGALAFTASGNTWMAFADPMTEASSDQDIFSTSHESCAWSAPQARNMASTYQFAYPSIVATGETLHLVMSGLISSSQGNDVYYATYDNGTWSPASALTMSTPGVGYGDYSPVAAASASGEVSVAYLSGGTSDSKVHVAKIASGALQGDAVALDVAGGCDDPQLVYDANGTRHVVAICGGDTRVTYSNDSGGSWA